MKEIKSPVFVSAIDTDAGKTIVTGALARQCLNRGINTITQKIVQTGVTGLSEDILMHRKIMGINLHDSDYNGITCPYTFKIPSSPHLAAKLEGIEISPAKINRATGQLCYNYDLVLMEGAGGLHVPLSPGYHICDFISDNNYPVVLVSSARLGSINHTLLSIDFLRFSQIQLLAVVYNCFGQANPDIVEDSFQVISNYTTEFFPDALVVRFPVQADVLCGEFSMFNNLIDLICQIQEQ